MRLIVSFKKYLRKAIFVLNIIVAALLVLSYLAAYISPIDFYGFAFLGLIYSFLLIANIIFIITWLFLKSKYFLISLLSILIGFHFLSSFFQISFNNKKSEVNEQEIKILSYNVRVFDRWHWSENKNTALEAFEFIKKSNANIVCLQEFYSSKLSGKNAEDSLIRGSVLKNSHISFTTKKDKKYNYGIATFTSYPILARGEVKLEKDENFCIYTDLLIDNDTLRVYNIHLESIHLGYDDYHLIENINNSDTFNVQGVKSILMKLKKGYQLRAQQADIIAAHTQKCPYPLILCGDFNDTPVSYVYHRLVQNKLDAFRESGNGISSTYINKFSTFRIDFIMHTTHLESFNYSTPRIELSDHYPVQCSMRLK